MITCKFQKYALQFIVPGGTSRGILTQKETYILTLIDSETNQVAYGECGLFKGLSSDDRSDYEQKLSEIVKRLPQEREEVLNDLDEWPSIYFGVEMLLKDWNAGGKRILFPSEFTEGKKGIDINGLIWMGDESFMWRQIEEKLQQGFSCIKMKIGAIDFETELQIIAAIRERFSANEIVLRVDANGAFSSKEALEKLQRLSIYDIHSIEQPIQKNQWQEMAELVEESPIPLALDEELIGLFDLEQKKKMLDTIRPPFLILKPSLIGGFKGTEEWIELMEQQGGNWWITSALESNIGLNAIAQFTFTKKNPLPQGLGTGGLYSNNFPSSLIVRNGKLFFDNDKEWNFNNLD